MDLEFNSLEELYRRIKPVPEPLAGPQRDPDSQIVFINSLHCNKYPDHAVFCFSELVIIASKQSCTAE